ncbi:JmjC domain-containing protein 7 [Vanrija pseudolonga]|uniref:JmjC domain-containing protein 7 n=1 Tax=Vanrija pseudolonga TaxID=143232 RepID=A0AAF0Y2E5_9TREE|nr:JmjC domain-containing protein 7 [Vanrija pseudolonga]
MPVDESVLEAYLDTLAEDYYDLQAPVPDQLPSSPSALAALRMVNKAHPTVIYGFSPITPGVERDWDAPATYSGIQGDKEVTIAVTDDGLADSVRVLADGSTTFVKPLDERMTMAAFLARLGNSQEKEALYLQSQDGNIYRAEAEREPELAPFQAVVQRDIPWMAEATGHSAEAVNLWVGTSASTTSFHHDPYENIYTVLSGSKTFTLVSPIDGLRLDQRFHPPSTLVRGEGGKLEPRPDSEPAHPVPWVQDLQLPDSVRPLTITLEKGESLYLPAGWWHKVEQNEGPSGLAVAVNYWYPAELRAERYALERFAQRVARTAGRDGVIPLPEDTLDDGIWGDDSDVTSADEWDPKDWGR